MLDFITNLFPPPQADQEQFRWQRAMAFALILVGGLTVANVALTWGLVPILFSGFATFASQEAQAIDLNNVQKSITAQSQQMERDKIELKALLLQAQLNQVFDAMCGAQRGNRRDEFIQWERQFTALRLEYNRISSQPYPMRSCG
jgi:hypothetical protein